jgi:hypothetical protein
VRPNDCAVCVLGMAALADADPALAAALRAIGTDTVGWSARTMSGEVLYDMPDVEVRPPPGGAHSPAPLNDSPAPT